MIPCPREPDLLAALGRGFVPPEVAEHAAACPDCGELGAIAGALLDDSRALAAEAPVPAAGTAWWRLRLRRRQEAAERARRSLVVGQAATVAAAIGLTLAFFGADLAAAARTAAAGGELDARLAPVLAALALTAALAGWAALRRLRTRSRRTTMRPHCL